MRKVFARIRWSIHRTTLDLLCPHKIYREGWKVNTQSTSWCLGVIISDSDVILPFIFSHGQTQHRGLHQEFGGGCADLDWEVGWKTQHLATGFCAILYKQKKNSLGCQKIFVTTSPLISSYQTPQIEFPLIYYVGARLSKTLSKLCTTPKMN